MTILHHHHHVPPMYVCMYAVKSSGDKSAGKIKMQKDPIFLQVVEEVSWLLVASKMGRWVA